MLCYQRPSLLGDEMGDLSRFFFLLQTFDQTPNQCFFPKIYLSALIKLPIPFSYSICKFLNDSLFFFLFVKTVGEAFVYVSFQDLSFSKAFFFSSFFFFFFFRGGYWAFLFYGLNQDLMDSVHMYSTFSRFSDHFLIVSGHSQIPSFSSFSNICPSVGCDTTQGYLTKKKKTSLQLKSRLQEAYLSLRDIKK
jgi:hypothetical protein